MQNQKKKSRKPFWITLGSVAACTAVAAAVLLTMNNKAIPTTENHADDGTQTLTLAKAEYPDLRKPLCTDDVDYDKYEKEWTAYREKRAELEQNKDCIKEIPDSYFADTMKTFLSGHEGENIAFSPVNAYMALAMVAQTVDGDSRQQILDVLGAQSVEQLRESANALWISCYQDGALNETLLANSMWLSNSMQYNTDTLQPLVDYYYASAFSGKMGSEEYNKLLQEWLNTQTGGMLENEVANVEFDAETVLGLASTVYYQAQWINKFSERNNSEGIFTNGSGEEQQAEFMNFSNDMYRYCVGDGYIATHLSIEEGDTMWFILPDEGTTPEQLIRDGALDEFMYGGVKDASLDCEIHFSMPKFDISSQCDLIEGMKQLGVTDIFDAEKSDFSPLCDNSEGIFIGEVDNAVRVSVDENGVSAASYIVMEYCGSALPPELPVIDFKLDRPFIFVIENNDDMVLFCGIVNELG